MSTFNQLIEQHWRHPYWWLTLILLPLSWLFALVVFLRGLFFKYRLFSRKKLPIPVIIIGNINVGGVGKTPILMYLATQLTNKGIKVGIISRGYGRKNTETLLVNQNGDSTRYGDEPLMIAQKTNVPVAVSTSRYEAGMLLLQNHPDLEFIFSDDGLQHYGLDRDKEILVVSEKLGFGNCHLLPQGPLRESIRRLKHVDAIICTDPQKLENKLLNSILTQSKKPLFYSTLKIEEAYQLSNPKNKCIVSQLGKQYQNIAALTGIGAPQKFYDTLSAQSLEPKAFFSFPDHHHFCFENIPQNFDLIITTQKDATKLKKLSAANIWVLPITVEINPNLADWLIESFRNKLD